eukprot:scaffold67501_cov69-Phaeocystis_antarctica.AAC.2
MSVMSRFRTSSFSTGAKGPRSLGGWWIGTGGAGMSPASLNGVKASFFFFLPHISAPACNWRAQTAPRAAVN